MIIVVANTKGGVGKSTVAVHLAAWLHAKGQRIILADCDTQRSSSAWLKEAVPSIPSVCLHSAEDILNALPQMGQEADIVIADGPGSNTETSRALLLRADLALVPCRASMLEVRALAQATEVLRQARDIRAGQPQAVLVLSMVGKHYRLTRDMKEAAATLRMPIAKNALAHRQIYADAPGQGTLVWKMGFKSKAATAEMERLFREILSRATLRKVSAPKRRRQA
jgi:chromosome partitioning protein